MSGGRYTQSDSAGGRTGTVRIPIWVYIGTVAPTGEYDRTVRVRRRCGLISNYFDHLLLYSLDSSATQLGCGSAADSNLPHHLHVQFYAKQRRVYT